MAGNGGRVEVGRGKFPVTAIVIAIVVLIAIVLGVAYAGRTPYGAEVSPTQELQAAVNDHLGRLSPRFPTRKVYYTCSSFSETMFSSDQSFAVAVEQGNWRPNVEQTPGPGNLEIVHATKKGSEPWQVKSKAFPAETFDPSAKPADSTEHPCNRTL